MTTRALTVALCSMIACTTPAQTSARPSRDRALFAMQSNFWVNLHHFLYVSARARRGLDATRPAVTSVLGDTAGVGTLSSSVRAAFDSALQYYDSAVATRDILFDSSLVAVNNRLAELEGVS